MNVYFWKYPILLLLVYLGSFLFSGYLYGSEPSCHLIFKLGSPNLTHQESYVSALQVSPDGTHLFSLGYRKLNSWEVNSGKPVNSFFENGKTFSPFPSVFSVSPDGGYIAAVVDSSLVLFDSKNLIKRETIISKGCFETVFSPKGHILAVGEKCGKIKFINSKTFKELLIIEPEEKEFCHLTFSPNGTQIAVKTENNLIIFWCTKDGKKLKSLGPFDADIVSFAFSKDSDKLAVTTNNGDLSLWSLPNGKKIGSKQIKFKYFAKVTTNFPIMFITDSLLVTGDRDGMMRFWNSSLIEIAQVNAHLYGIKALACTPRASCN